MPQGRSVLGHVAIVALIAAGLARAAPRDSPGAAYRRGDFATAVKLLRPQASAGEVSSQIMLGQMYLKGQGVEADPNVAIEWLEKAAKQGAAIAAYDLGLIRITGIGGARDAEAAVRWFTPVGHLRFADAAYNLALIYEKGEGIARNLPLALKWIDAGLLYPHSVSAQDLRPSLAALKVKVVTAMSAEELSAAADLSAPEGPLEVARVLNQKELLAKGSKDYPLGLAGLGRGGGVVALVHVRADGTVAETRIERSSGHHELDDLTVKLLARALVQPGLRHGVAAESWQLVRWDFAASEAPLTFSKLNAMRPVHVQ